MTRTQGDARQAPHQARYYLLKDARGTVLYVGKAQNLRSRVRQYWQHSRAVQPLRMGQRWTASPTSSTPSSTP